MKHGGFLCIYIYIIIYMHIYNYIYLYIYTHNSLILTNENRQINPLAVHYIGCSNFQGLEPGEIVLKPSPKVLFIKEI